MSGAISCTDAELHQGTNPVGNKRQLTVRTRPSLFSVTIVLCRAVRRVKDIDYKDGKYLHYFEVHSPMGIMRLRAEDAAGKLAWISNLQKQAQVCLL